MTRRAAALFALLVLAWLQVAPLPAAAGSVRFALVGDTPYSARARAELQGLLDAMAHSGVDFIVHVGDF